MKYKIAKSETAGRELKRMAAGEIKRAQKALSKKVRAHGLGEGTAASAVHEARRRFKKVRGLLRLARHGLGRKRFRRENVFLRDAGREIRAVRDAVALVEALDGLTRRCGGEKPPEIVGELRRLLVRDARRMARGILSDGALARTSRRLSGELKRVTGWKLGDFTWKDAERAWRVRRAACRRAFEAARAEPTDENLHEWRKRAKDLKHEMLLLAKAYPELRERTREVAALTDILGEHRDLALLAQAAAESKEALHFPDQLKGLLARLAARRRKLRAEAFALAAKKKS